MQIPQTRTILKQLSLTHNDSEITQFSSDYNYEQQVNQKQIFKFHSRFQEILTGLFPKKTMNMTWRDRYFCLTPSRLLYYSNPQKQQLKGCFNLISLGQYDIRIQANYPIITLTISVPTHKIVEQKELLKLSIEDRKVFHLWRDTLSKIINQGQDKSPKSESPLLNLQTVSCKKRNGNFWNKLIISQKQFMSYASHLDILLFRSKGDTPLPSVQRFFMRSFYDHVGIIIRDQFQRIFILEAIESRGVWVTPWQQMLPVFKNTYEYIGYRKLILKAGQKIDEIKFETLINKLLGKKYELTIKKLISSPETQMSQQGDIMLTKSNNSEKKIQKQKTYFCSELVAQIYLKLSFLKNRKKNQFWPKDFQQNLILENQAKLSPIMQIQI